MCVTKLRPSITFAPRLKYDESVYFIQKQCIKLYKVYNQLIAAGIACLLDVVDAALNIPTWHSKMTKPEAAEPSLFLGAYTQQIADFVKR